MADFVGVGRHQVFIRVEMGGVGNYVLDFDGERVRELYFQGTGRIRSRMKRTSQGKWSMVENWPANQWEDHEELGTGYAVGVNTINRSLHWNGSSFVPDRPGPSRIVR